MAAIAFSSLPSPLVGSSLLPLDSLIEVLDSPPVGKIGHPDTIERGPNYHPIDLGLKSISDYEYHIAKRDEIIRYEHEERRKTPQQARGVVEKVKAIIEGLKTGSVPCYFLNNSNPFVALVQPDGQIWWRSIYVTCLREVEEIVHHVTKRNQSVIVHVGSHGSITGSTATDDPSLADAKVTYTAVLYMITDNPKAAAIQLSKRQSPDYNETANHAIDTWCHSITSIFTNPTQLYYCDGSRDPSDYRDVTGEVMTNPHHFPNCRKLDGRVHYYDLSTIEKLRRILPVGETQTICRVDRCKEIIDLNRPEPAKSLKREIEVFQQQKAIRKAERQLAERQAAQVGTLIHPLILAGAPVPDRFFQDLVGNIVATVPRHIEGAAVIVPSVEQIQEISHRLASIDPSAIKDGIQTDFSGFEIPALDDMFIRLSALRSAAHSFARTAHREVEEARQRQDLTVALARSTECGQLVEGLPNLDVIYHELETFIHDRKLREEKALTKQQKEELQAERQYRQESEKSREELEKLAKLASGKVQKQARQIQRLTSSPENRLLRPLDEERRRLKAYIKEPGYVVGWKVASFPRQDVARISFAPDSKKTDGTSIIWIPTWPIQDGGGYQAHILDKTAIPIITSAIREFEGFRRFEIQDGEAPGQISDTYTDYLIEARKKYDLLKGELENREIDGDFYSKLKIAVDDFRTKVCGSHTFCTIERHILGRE